MNVEMTNGYTRFGGDITMAKEKQISTDSVKHGHAYDNNLQSQHGPWANPQQKAGPYGVTEANTLSIQFPKKNNKS